MRLQDKVAIVTGAASGIGLAAVRRFVAEGATVTAVDVNARGLDETIDALADGDRGKITAHVADVSQAEQVEQVVAGSAERAGRLDVVFSNAAIMRNGSVVDLAEKDWDDMFGANVKAAYLFGKYGVPVMKQSGGGSFICTASVNGFYAESDIAGYCATKGAVIQLTRAMAVDHGPDGVRVNCICPGWIETPMSLPFLEETPEGRDFGCRIAPAGRIGLPDDVASLAVFLASDESSFVTGSAYTVDGGWTAGMTKAIALI